MRSTGFPLTPGPPLQSTGARGAFDCDGIPVASQCSQINGLDSRFNTREGSDKAPPLTKGGQGGLLSRSPHDSHCAAQTGVLSTAIRHGLVACLAIFSLAVCSTANARQPEIRNVNIRGLQIGATTTLTIDGTDLLPSPRLFLDEQALEATLDPASTPTRVVLAIPLPEAIAPGIGVLRLTTSEGFSNSLLVGLDRLPQLPLAEEIAARPVALQGSVPGSGVSRTAFSGKAGEDVIVEVEARRLGSKLRPVIHVYDSRRVQVAWGLPSNSLGGDSRITLKLPRDDRYTIELHDLQYGPPGASFFRLKVGHWQFADLAFPPAVPAGQETAVELLGNLPGSRVTIKPAAEFDLAAIAWPAATQASGPPPSVVVSSYPELTEAATAAQPMALPSVPVAVSGRLNAPNQRDRYLLPVTPGMKLICEVFAERIASRIDASLELRNKEGGVLAASDDFLNSTDPRLEYTVPAGLDAIELVVRDAVDLATDDAIYRLVISSADAPRPSFDVITKFDSINIAASEPHIAEALVTRKGYDGPLQLQVAGLPAGVTVQGTEIPAGANGTLLTFLSTSETPAQLVTRMKVQSPDGTLVKAINVEAATDDRTPSWLRERLAVATTSKPTAPFQIAWADEAALPQLVLASKKPIPIKLVRPSSTFGPVRLSLMTAQPLPKVNGQPNLPQSIRVEQVVEVAVDPAVKAAGDALAPITKQHAEAVQQALAAQGDAKVAADAKVADLAAKKAAAEAALRDAEAKANYQSALSLVVPSTLIETICDISVRAELLNTDRNVVLRTVYAPVRRLAVLNPLVIKIANPAVEATLDPATGATVKVPAKIERLAGYAGDVTVTISGLPAGVTAANVAVKADQSEFPVEIKIPANFAAEEIKGLKLTATGPADPLSANVPVKSAEVDVVIKVVKVK